MGILIAALLLPLAAAMLYGWGGVLRRLTKAQPGHWTMTVAIGLAGWIFIGGVLNLARISYPLVLDLLAVIGLALAAWQIQTARQTAAKNRKRSKTPSQRPYLIACAALIAIVFIFTLATQLEPTMWNRHDDLQKYFTHVIRMMATGTAAGSPLNSLGSETFGAQAFLQELPVGLFGITAINAADAIFGLGLTMLLAAGVGLGRPALAWTALAATVLVFLIDPLYVNVSPLYSGAALIFCLVTLSLDPRETGTGRPPAALIGLIYAALVALKPTFGLFILLHFIAELGADLSARISFGLVLRRKALIVFWSALFLAPWVVPFAPSYYAAFAAPLPPLDVALSPAAESINLFSVSAMSFGGTPLTFTIAVIAIAVSLGVALWRAPAAERALRLRHAEICAAVIVSYLIMIFVFGPLLSGKDMAFRYAAPMLIGAVPALLALHGASAPTADKKLTLLPTLLAALVGLVFLPSAFERINLARSTGSSFGFLRMWEPEKIAGYRAVNQQILHGGASDYLRSLQARVPEGEPVLVWNLAPFLLDFHRNPIIDANMTGVATPWSRLPPVRYIIWQYAGFGANRPELDQEGMKGPGKRDAYTAARDLEWANFFTDLTRRGEVAYHDANMVVLKLPSGTQFP